MEPTLPAIGLVVAVAVAVAVAVDAIAIVLRISPVPTQTCRVVQFALKSSSYIVTNLRSCSHRTDMYLTDTVNKTGQSAGEPQRSLSLAVVMLIGWRYDIQDSPKVNADPGF